MFCGDDYGYNLFEDKKPKEVAINIIRQVFNGQNIDNMQFAYKPFCYKGKNNLQDRIEVYYRIKNYKVMKANAPEKIYIQPNAHDGWFESNPHSNIFVEYTRTDAFVDKAAQFLYDYNQKQVLKHGARATLGCGEYTINVDEFRKYMKGE